MGSHTIWHVSELLCGSIPPPSSPSCPTCLQGLQRANRCGRAFEISVPYKFKVFGNGFLINLPTLSFWKRQKSQIHSYFNLPWYFLSRWLKSCLWCVFCISTYGPVSSLQTPKDWGLPGRMGSGNLHRGLGDRARSALECPGISGVLPFSHLPCSIPLVGRGGTPWKPRYVSALATS